MPGRYDVSKRVGQLVVTNVSNFTLKGSSLKNDSATIICRPNATLGFTFTQSHNVEISNIHLSHCCADLEVNISKLILTTYNEHLNENLRHLLQKLGSCDSDLALCCNSLAIINNMEVTIYRTTILHSRGVGVLDVGNGVLDISKSQLAYNQINCIILVTELSRLAKNNTFSISESYIMFGQSKFMYLASGLNLFVYLREHKFDICLTNVTLKDNKAPYGNFYVPIYIQADPTIFSIDVNILIRNITSIQTELAMPGMVMKYNIQLEDDSDLWSTDTWPWCRWRFPLSIPPYNSYCSPWQNFKWLSLEHYRRIYIVLQDSYFIGSCVTVKDSEVFSDSGTFTLEMRGIKIDKSMCRMALSIVDRNTYYLQLTDLTISNSYNNIFSVNVGSESILTLTGNTSFTTNQGSVSVISGKVNFRDVVQFSSNTAHKYESILLISDSGRVFFRGEITFINNRGRQGGAISVYGSHIRFNGNATFISNVADNGGAISLKEGSIIDLEMDTQLIFKANTAKSYGGAIYVEDAGLWVRKEGIIKCFIHFSTGEGPGRYSIEFENNTAEIAGMALYGGWIDICKTNSNIQPFHYFNFKGESSRHYISSNPSRVCMCTNTTPNTHKTEAYIETIPGQTFEIEIVAVGQRFGVVPATVRIETDFNNIINHLQQLQETEKECTPLKLTVCSSNKNETLQLRVDKQDTLQQISNRTAVLAELLQFKLIVILKDCPLGFEFDHKQNTCSCHYLLLKKCNFTSYTINRYAQQWISTSLRKEIVMYEHCPFDYCKPHDISLNLSTPDDQCAFNRSGILCGACQLGLSQVLGTSNCKKCSNTWLLLILVFALAGVGLVTFLMVLNLTVSTGRINGLIFYANIVRANAATFFPGQTANSFLSWFIAWLNLDLGIETCLYNGLDAYAKTWLQLGFPLYIWFMAGFIIFSSNYSKRVAKFCGKNAVQVLATLFFLSYAKLLRVSITVFQPTHLRYGHNIVKVWHYDGNIGYLGRQHIPLMLVVLLFFVLFLIPYTLVLFGIQWLQPLSHYKLLNWVNKLKPLLDAYTGPYKDKHRYWTGLLLLVRISLYIVFSTNTTGDPAINLFAIVMIVICLFAYLAACGGVYKIWLINLLEHAFLLNLVISSATILYTMSINKPMYVHTVSTVSVSVTLSGTILLVVYHSLIAVLEKLKLDERISAMWKNKADSARLRDHQHTTEYATQLDPQIHVTHSVIELNEPLLES